MTSGQAVKLTTSVGGVKKDTRGIILRVLKNGNFEVQFPGKGTKKVHESALIPAD